MDSYTLVDFIGSLDVGPGRLEVGISNLFDLDYLAVDAQERVGIFETRRRAGTGRTFSFRYAFEF